MVRRIHNIGAWLCLQPGEAFQLSAEKRRNVRIDFNSESPETVVHLVDSDGTVTFLSRIDGLQTVEFFAGSDEPMPEGVERTPLVVSVTSDAPCWYRTIDGDVEAYSSVAESFVKVATRRARNPQLELMMYKQDQNALRREMLLRDEIAAMNARLEAAAEAAKVTEQTAPIINSEEAAANDNGATASADAAGEDATAPVAGSVSAKPAAKAAKQRQAAPATGGDGANG